MRILVVFHVYYEHLAAYYLEKMRNIHSCEWDLIVTGSCLSDHLRDEVSSLKGDAVFLECANVGYDVWPFIAGIKSVRLEDYDFVIKLHTKNEDEKKFRFHGEVMSGAEWKGYMVDALLKDKETFGKLLALFKDKPEIGIAYSQKLNFNSAGGHLEDGSMLKKELARLGIERKSSMFCAGTMFAARACCLEFLHRNDISAGIFQESGPSHGSSSMGHVYERLIPIAILSEGYGLKLIPASRLSGIKFTLRDSLSNMGKWLVSVDYFGDDNVKHLKLFGHIFRAHR